MTQSIPLMSAVDEIGWSDSVDRTSTSLKVRDFLPSASVFKKRPIHVTNIVEQLFVEGWRHRKKARPDVQYIFKILWPELALGPFLNYRYILSFLAALSLIYHRDQVQNTLKAKDGRGNEKLLFHGTDRACLLGESSASVVLCGLDQCYLCSIVGNSFDVRKCGKSIRSLIFSCSHISSRLKEYVQAVGVKLRFEQLYFECGSDSDMVSIPHLAHRVRFLSR